VTAQPPLEPARRKRRRRVMAGAAAATALALAIPTLVLYWRGTRIVELREPTAAAEGPRCGLIQRGDVSPIRCAMLVEAPPERVWAVIADYRAFGDLFQSRLWRLDFDRVDPDGTDGVRVVGFVRSVLGTWPIDVRMQHAEGEGVRTASWDASDGWDMNRGGWSVAPAPGGGTLLSYEIEVRTRRAPRFLINDVLLDQLPGMLRTVARAAGAPA
jgi:hypothetical protein